MTRSVLLLLAILSVSASTWADTTVYKRVRPDGTTEFSDSPIPGGTEVQVPNVPTYKSTPVPQSTPSQPQKPSQVMSYEAIAITSPTNNETVFFDAEGMPVTVDVRPGLQRGHRVEIFLDGKMVAQGEQSSFMIKDVYRGSHTLAAAVVDSSGKQVVSSNPVTFQMIQHFKRP